MNKLKSSAVTEPEAFQPNASGSRLHLWIALAGMLMYGAACGDHRGTTEGGGANLRIAALYLVQSVQSRDGAVPLVAGNDAYLRVFVVSSVADTPAPAVRVRLLQDGAAEQVITIQADAAVVPTSVDQSSLTKSWNVRIPGATIQPGLRILAEVDPTNQVVESDESDNSFPTSGAPLALQISALQPFRVRFVPMVQEENGKTGRIDASNIESYLTFTRKIHPVSTIDADLRAPYTVRGLGFDPQGNTWQAAVAELDAVRVAEGSDRFYYGVVNTDYDGGGVVGIAAGIPANAALGWDRFPDASITVAHEIGHGWGRRHAPCGGAGGADPAYPYSLGLIGAYGLDVETKEVKLPSGNTDIMGYCNVRFWISDYTFTGIFNYRLTHPASAVAPRTPSLVIWGRIENGIPVLEPAFPATTLPSLPESSGPYLIEAIDGLGRRVFSHSFSAAAIPDIDADVRPFAFAIPVSGEEVARITSLRLVARGREALVSTPASSPDGTYPLVVVRDAKSGEILSLARNGKTSDATYGRNVRLEFSDGIHAIRR